MIIIQLITLKYNFKMKIELCVFSLGYILIKNI